MKFTFAITALIASSEAVKLGAHSTADIVTATDIDTNVLTEVDTDAEALNWFRDKFLRSFYRPTYRLAEIDADADIERRLADALRTSFDFDDANRLSNALRTSYDFNDQSAFHNGASLSYGFPQKDELAETSTDAEAQRFLRWFKRVFLDPVRLAEIDADSASEIDGDSSYLAEVSTEAEAEWFRKAFNHYMDFVNKIT